MVRKRVDYSEEEILSLGDLYKDELSYPEIADLLNDIFHSGNRVRNRKSVQYIIKKLYGQEKNAKNLTSEDPYEKWDEVEETK